MGKCFSCFKSPSIFHRDQVANSSRDCSKSDIIKSKEENTPMFSHSECAVPHLSTVLFQKNGNAHTRTVTRAPGMETACKEKCYLPFYPKKSGASIKSAGLHVDNRINKPISESKIISLYDTYKDPFDEDIILTEGIERLCSDLRLSPDEFKILILAWKFDAHQMCQFTKDEFVTGCKTIRADSIKGIQYRLNELAVELESDRELFKSLYRFTFRFGLDNNMGQRILPADIAICLWQLVFTIYEPPILSKWLQFLTCNSQIRGIPRDTWNMFLNFSESIGDDFSIYDDTEAWPSIFDEFVEYEKDKLNQNVISPSKEEYLE